MYNAGLDDFLARNSHEEGLYLSIQLLKKQQICLVGSEYRPPQVLSVLPRELHCHMAYSAR